MVKHIYPLGQDFNGVGLYGTYLDELRPRLDQPVTQVWHFELGYTGVDLLWQAYGHLGKRGRTKLVLTLHDPPVITGQPFRRYITSRALPLKALRKALDLSFGHWVIKRVVRGADAIIVLNPLAKAGLIRRYGVSPDRLFDSPLPVLTPLVPRTQPGTGLRLLFYGNVSGHKGVDTLIRACLNLMKPLGDWSLEVVGKLDGDPAYTQQIKDLIDSPGLGSHISLRGFVDDDTLARLVAQADIVILPYHDTGIIHASGPLITSLAAGKAVIATRIPIFTPEIEDGRTGLLFDPGDVDELSQKLLRLARDKDLRHELGTAAATAIMRTHNDDAIIESLNKVYKSCED